jgi:hypothetical protein
LYCFKEVQSLELRTEYGQSYRRNTAKLAFHCQKGKWCGRFLKINGRIENGGFYIGTFAHHADEDDNSQMLHAAESKSTESSKPRPPA